MLCCLVFQVFSVFLLVCGSIRFLLFCLGFQVVSVFLLVGVPCSFPMLLLAPVNRDLVIPLGSPARFRVRFSLLLLFLASVLVPGSCVLPLFLKGLPRSSCWVPKGRPSDLFDLLLAPGKLLPGSAAAEESITGAAGGTLYPALAGRPPDNLLKGAAGQHLLTMPGPAAAEE